MKILTVVTAVLVFMTAYSLHAAPAKPKMRPYSGIGVLTVSILSATETEPADPVPLYAEPGIHRQGDFNPLKAPHQDWIFGGHNRNIPLIVMARKGAWLKVVYDEAGREAWLSPQRKDQFTTWDHFLKGRTAQLLTGLRKQYYQAYTQPGKGPSLTLSPKQVFKVVKIESDWVLVMPDHNSMSWLRWRDEDGRLLICLEHTASTQN